MYILTLELGAAAIKDIHMRELQKTLNLGIVL
jgi:hypothetical protein